MNDLRYDLDNAIDLINEARDGYEERIRELENERDAQYYEYETERDRADELAVRVDELTEELNSLQEELSRVIEAKL